MKNITCCFTGHRKLPAEKIEQIVKRLDREIENLISQGVKNFISGGALGFDQIAASLIVTKKEIGRDIRLIFALPCKNQDELWNDTQKRLYRNLLVAADEIIYISENYYDGCAAKRNRYMVKRSAYCICGAVESSQWNRADDKVRARAGVADSKCAGIAIIQFSSKNVHRH